MTKLPHRRNYPAPNNTKAMGIRNSWQAVSYSNNTSLVMVSATVLDYALWLVCHGELGLVFICTFPLPFYPLALPLYFYNLFLSLPSLSSPLAFFPSSALFFSYFGIFCCLTVPWPCNLSLPKSLSTLSVSPPLYVFQ